MAILQNEFIRLDFDDATGALTGLLNKKTGWQAIRQPKLAQGVILLVPVPDHRKTVPCQNCKSFPISMLKTAPQNYAGSRWQEKNPEYWISPRRSA